MRETMEDVGERVIESLDAKFKVAKQDLREDQRDAKDEVREAKLRIAMFFALIDDDLVEYLIYRIEEVKAKLALKAGSDAKEAQT